MEIDVKGNSGCNVDIVREGKDLFVVKSTKDSNYAARLALQGEKQRSAVRMNIPHVSVPRVYGISDIGGVVSIKMDYVYSKNYIEFFETAGAHEIDLFTNSVLNFVDYELANSTIRMVDKSVFTKKVDEVENKMRMKRPEICECGGLEYCKMLRSRLLEEDDISIPVGKCHGDLTFSNILFSGSEYYLIDFLDSYIETPLQDIAKLRQDSKYLWSRLMYKQPYDALRLKMILVRIDAAINEHYESFVWYSKFYPLMQAINILRILPYAKEKHIADYLFSVLDDLL